MADKNIIYAQNFAACICDFDGVIIDSEPLHAEAKRLTLDHFGIPYYSQLFTDFKGRTDKAFFQFVAQQLAAGVVTAEEMDAYKRGVYAQLFAEVPLVPGVQSFLTAARRTFPKLGLTTSATRRDFGLAAAKYQLTQWFDVIVTGEDTARHKPDPEPYLKTLAALGVTGAHTLVIEDSPNGIHAAKSAQCKVAALTTTFPDKGLHQAGADLVVASFAELGQALGLILE